MLDKSQAVLMVRQLSRFDRLLPLDPAFFQAVDKPMSANQDQRDLSLLLSVGVGIAALLVAAIGGCGTFTPEATEPALEQVRDEAGSQHIVRLEHDFGVVPAGSKHTHTFELTNQSAVPWMLRGIERTCACTVAKVSTNQVSPGESLSVEVAYASPAKSTDDSRVIRLHIDELPHPVELCVHAQSREPLTVLPYELVATCRADSTDVPSMTLQVTNFSECEWTDLQVHTSCDWLIADTSAGKVSTRQQYEVTFCPRANAHFG